MALEMSSTTKAKIAAAALTALSAMSGAFSANAQQMASVQPDYSTCNQLAQSGNHLGASQCRVDTLRAHTRQVQDNTRTEANLSQCISFLSTKKSAGTTFDRPITRDNACAIARQLGMRNG